MLASHSIRLNKHLKLEKMNTYYRNTKKWSWTLIIETQKMELDTYRNTKWNWTLIIETQKIWNWTLIIVTQKNGAGHLL